MIQLISSVLCKLGLHGPKALGETPQYRSDIPSSHELHASNIVLHQHRWCRCCGARWRKVIVVKKYPFKWERTQ